MFHRHPAVFYFILSLTGLILRNSKFTPLLFLFLPVMLWRRFSMISILVIIPLFAIYSRLRLESPGLPAGTTQIIIVEGDNSSVLKVRGIIAGGHIYPYRTKIYMGGKFHLEKYVTYIVRGKIERIEDVVDSSYAKYLKNLGVHVAVFPLSFTYFGEKRNIFVRLRSYIEGVLTKRDRTGLYRALILGDRGYLSRSIKNIFKKTGTYHILALSGLHVGIITLIFYYLLLLLRVRKRTAKLLTLPFLFFYLKITGFMPSLLRASLLFLCLILSFTMGRRPNPINALGAAGFVSLIICPSWIYSIGFQLSYMATFGIIVSLTLFSLNRNFLARFILIPIVVTVSAQIFTLPIILKNFGGFSPISPLTNLVIVPLLSLLMAELALGIVSGFFPTLSNLFFNVADSVLILMLKTGILFSKLPYSYLKARMNGLNILIYYLLLASVVAALYAMKKRH